MAKKEAPRMVEVPLEDLENAIGTSAEGYSAILRLRAIVDREMGR